MANLTSDMESAHAEYPGTVGLGREGVGMGRWHEGEELDENENFSKSHEFTKKNKKIFFGYNKVLRI
jgi:hypothetical protein